MCLWCGIVAGCYIAAKYYIEAGRLVPGLAGTGWVVCSLWLRVSMYLSSRCGISSTWRELSEEEKKEEECEVCRNRAHFDCKNRKDLLGG